MSADPDLDHTPFPCVRAHQIELGPAGPSFLIDTIWTLFGVGAIGGLPKTNKTWLCFDMAVSVASGTPCLGRFEVSQPGPVLIYAAEDSLVQVRERLEGLCRSRGLRFEDLDVHVITVPSMRLDRTTDQTRLRNTVARIRPRMFILDPLVRVYGRIDENSASELSRFLAYLRALQREFDTAVVLVHHARKAQAGVQQAGQALRGSGDLHAWVDDLLYLKKVREGFQLTAEHRSAPAPAPVIVDLVDGEERPPHLAVISTAETGSAETVCEQILLLLTRHPDLETAEAIRRNLGLRKERVLQALRDLQVSGHLRREGRRWRIAHTPRERSPSEAGSSALEESPA